MPGLFILTVVVQLLFAWHVHRTGRNMQWIYLILFLPGMGCAIYFLLEVLPEIVNGPQGHQAKSKFRRWWNPNKEYNDAKYAYDGAPTVANRIRLAQVLSGRRDYDAVIALLEPALSGHFEGDVMLLEGLAYAYYDKGDYRKAMDYIDKIYAPDEATPQDYIKLLRARTHIAMGNNDAALTELGYLMSAFTGEEARITLAQLHERMGNKEEAQKIYQEIVKRAKHSPKYYQKTERQWIELAKQKLS